MNLTAEQIRVLGCLAEKEATTPDAYPLSTNSLVLACNQRSSRDPVVDYDESAVTGTMISLRELELARTSRGDGSRVYKHAHLLRDALQLDAAALAVLSVLMLRGPQTVGELRMRTERQHPFGTLEEVESALQELADRQPPLVTQLSRGPGQKETRWSHVLGEDADRAGPARPPAPARPDPESPEADRLAALASDVAALRRDVAALESRLAALEAGR